MQKKKTITKSTLYGYAFGSSNLSINNRMNAVCSFDAISCKFFIAFFCLHKTILNNAVIWMCICVYVRVFFLTLQMNCDHKTIVPYFKYICEGFFSLTFALLHCRFVFHLSKYVFFAINLLTIRNTHLFISLSSSSSSSMFVCFFTFFRASQLEWNMNASEAHQ